MSQHVFSIKRWAASLICMGVTAIAAPKDDWATTAAKRAEWWSLQPTKVVAPPLVDNHHWRKNPIDRFIYSNLKTHGLQPAPAAESQVLMRRLAFVLTGLPPTPEQMDRWQKQHDLAKVTDELLASQHFGERFARHWMDVARYSDTYGYEWDNPAKGSWRYRDYLIRAFNADIGFDQLVREQIAGDLLPKPRINTKAQLNESLIGPMFLHLGEHRHGDSLGFNGVHQEMIDNKIDALSKAFLATTVACARCHDHKLDAVSQRDYYALASVLMSARWTSRVVDAPGRHDATIAELKKLRGQFHAELAPLWQAAAKDFGKQIEVAFAPNPWRKALDGNTKTNKPPALESVAYPIHGLLLATNKLTIPERWTALQKKWQTESASRKAWNDTNSTVLTDFTKPDLPTGWVMEGDGMRHGYVTTGTPLIALEGDAAILRLLPRGYHTHALSSKLPGAVRTPRFADVKPPHFSVALAGGEWAGTIMPVENAFQTERLKFLDRNSTGWERFNARTGDGKWRLRMEIATANLNPNFPPRTGLARVGKRRMKDEDFGIDKRSWFSLTAITTHGQPAGPKNDLAAFKPLYAATTPKTRAEAAQRLGAWFGGAVNRWVDGKATNADITVINWLLEKQLLPTQANATPRLAKLVAAYREAESRIGHAATVNSMDERDLAPVAYKLNVRGDVNQPDEGVPRDFLKIFSEQNGVANSQGSGRLELAEFLARPDNPLTARVYVNRVWHWLFGRGIVATPNDFGHLGEAPSHPELLDWLAREFVRNGWSTKWLVREIVSSRAFRQGGTVTAAAREKDPDNRMLHHYPTRRLEAEAIRDNLLAVSGRLDRQLFGRPIEPPRVREHSPKRLYNGPLDGDGRRSVYLRVTIMEPPAFLVGFNFPDPKLPTGARDTTNVPAQALMLLNDPFVNAQSEHWGKILAADKSQTVDERITRMFRRAFARKPSDAELKTWNKAFESFVSIDDAVNGSPKAWADLAHIMFNTKEFIYYR